MLSSCPVKTILFVSNLFPRPDASRNGMFNLAFAGALHARLLPGGGGVDVLVPVPEWRFWRWRRIQGWALPVDAEQVCGKTLRVRYVPCFYLPLVGRSLSFLWYAAAFRSVLDFARGCDVVIASWLYPDAVAASSLASRLAKPFWVRLHGTDRFHLDAPIRGRVCRRTVAKAAGVIVNAAFMKNELVRRGIPGKRIAVVPNGIDHAVFHPGDESCRDAGTILWVGNMVSIKRPELAMHAFAGLIRMNEVNHSFRGKRLHLVMAGTGPMRRRLVHLVKRLGIDKQVTFTGSLSRQDVASRMRRAAVLLLTSRSEGMPNVVIEALACGTPVVSTSVGDVPGILSGNTNGLIVHADAGEGLEHGVTEALEKALDTKWDRNAIQASVFVHDWSRAAASVQQIIESTGLEGKM